ncbi:esterase-like activity of phytase family protein [Pseudomonas cannabina pv. alisalensis]|uniref:DNA topoisomerase IV n=5 Tax=Pseudomonas syringae group TaxID=136849 RepID=A0A8T8C6I9_PSEYM|nr:MULTISPECIES: esterase-like activity of phytase family protein [Pseudomonas syringae group]MBM0138536.1 esterase-like activity of phytase family protein [Pseudomonas cannabina pv. alisalensis]QHE99282.1 DNA topoisomerase IV [Pseudomonas syringae pv. maculicola str. ES4326]QQN21542.1 esterase-like activity of phytase family protein [Pseudomonas cannabina pv. alisalensis]UBY99944.1 esterase-like activity of phytase family protein [Pseudomonas cannabina pv. alisalensis]
MMRAWRAALVCAALASSVVAPVFAAPLEALKLQSEHPVDGMVGGNLSGLAMCNGQLWTVSDRDDNLLYRLDVSENTWKAEPHRIDAPAPQSYLPLNLRSMAGLSALVRGGNLDFEGVSCDAAGNRYLISEAYGTVLKVPVTGAPSWLPLPQALIEQARAQGMLQHFNAIFEGIAVNAAGDRIWLAAEREKRGLLVVKRDQEQWTCGKSCVLLSESGLDNLPPEQGSKKVSTDFSDLSLYNGKLFTLERAVYRICRRDVATGQIERCWSFAKEAMVPSRRYDQPYGLTEALVVDESGAWIGIDNNFGARADGEKRPIVWRFAAPKGGWSADQ